MGRELHVHSHPSGVEHWRHLTEIVALVIAAVWGFYVFIYQENIKPAGEPVELETTLSVDHTPLQSNKEFIRVGIQMKNIGNPPLELGGLVVNAYGVKYTSRTGEHIEKSISGIVEESRALVPGKPVLQYTFADTWRAFGGQRAAALLPGADFPETFVFAIPPRTFDVVKIEYFVCWSRPRSKVWNVPVDRQADGSFWFRGAVSAENVHAGLRCHYQIRGEYYPV
ncbi:MAG TPA: hypothetical protein VFL13_10220 [Candidatus Baltobacteraceae bacterium]|nr:hypothetical protein [Candidatus Baltobacteraceae bacterium]